MKGKSIMFFTKFFTIVFLIFFSCIVISASAPRPRSSASNRELLLDAICMVESNNNPLAVGDNGNSRGAYQCTEAAWRDSRYSEPYLPNVWDPKKSRAVCEKYCIKYAGENASNEAWARTWNGGPTGPKKKATLGYWKKVKKKMEELKKEKK